LGVFKLIGIVVGNRVKPEDELEGLDIPEMGVIAYSGIKMDKNSETPLSK
jgi:ammonium transporter, Amt family